MTATSTTIRVTLEQRDRLRHLAAESDATMSETLTDALEALRREQFYEAMADAEATMRRDPAQWAEYQAERDAWLNPDLTGA